MRILLLFVFGFFGAVAARAQNDFVTDSLQKLLLKQKEDTNKVALLLKLSTSLSMQSNINKALENANEALALAGKLGWALGKAMAYRELGFINKIKDPPQSLNFHRLSRHFFQESGNKKEAAYSTFYVGTYYADQRKNTEALEYYNEALKQFMAMKELSGEAKTFMQIGKIHRLEQNDGEALACFTKALKQYELVRDKRGVAECYTSLGHLYTGKQARTEALKYLYKAFGVYESLNDKSNMALTLTDIGSVHLSTANFEEAINCRRRSLAIWEELKNYPQIIFTCNSLANHYQQQKRYQEALNIILQRSMPALKALNYQESYVQYVKSGISLAYQELGSLAAAAGDKTTAARYFEDALQNAKEALQSAVNNDNKGKISNLYWIVGTAYTKLKQYDSAAAYFERCLAFSKSINYKINVCLSHESLAGLHHIAGNYKKAYEHYKIYMEYRDTLLINDNEMRKVAEAKGRYEFIKKEDSLQYEQQLAGEKLKQQQLLAIQQHQKLQLQEATLRLAGNEKELARQEFLRAAAELKAEQSQRQEKEKQLTLAEKEAALQQANLLLKSTALNAKEKELAAQRFQRNLLFAGAAILASLAFVLFRNKQQKQRTKNLLEKQRLRTQIAADLHDEIGSTLTSISFFSEAVKMQVPEEAATARNMLDKIGENARTVVSTMKDIVWVINPQNDVSASLIIRMKSHLVELCNGRNIQPDFQAEGTINETSLDLHQRKNIYLVYKEAVHNAVKYAGCSRITVSLLRNNGSFDLTVQDNGTGFTPCSVEEGNGLPNMKRRADEIGAQFAIDTAPGKGTNVRLSVNITRSGDNDS